MKNRKIQYKMQGLKNTLKNTLKKHNSSCEVVSVWEEQFPNLCLVGV
jgi:hypothetical protein